MKILHISFSDVDGGAAKAAFRAHQALLANGIDSQMFVAKMSSGDPYVFGPCGKYAKGIALMRAQLGLLFARLLKTSNTVIHSPQLLTSNLVEKINLSDADIVNLHWIQGELLSVRDIAKIKKPLVWTLHDMWAFCGAEHYTFDYRWRDGYCRANRPIYESGFDLNRWTWNRKRRYWKQPIKIIAPSNWLAGCVKKSFLMKEWPVTVIPNPIDTDSWKPIPKKLARDLLGLPDESVPLILFGAAGGGGDPRKGFDLLIYALKWLKSNHNIRPDMQLVVFGQAEPLKKPDMGFSINYVGRIYDDLTLRVIYSSADMTIIPSRQDNLPNTAVEAQSCGIPVVAFNVGGLSDIVNHKETGYLAKPFDEKDLAKGILWVLNQAGDDLSMRSRQNAVNKFSMKKYSENFVKYGRELL